MVGPATVTIVQPVVADHRSGLVHVMTNLHARLSDVFDGPMMRPDCVPPVTPERGAGFSRLAEEDVPDLLPAQINPDLAPGMNTSPRNH